MISQRQKLRTFIPYFILKKYRIRLQIASSNSQIVSMKTDEENSGKFALPLDQKGPAQQKLSDAGFQLKPDTR